MKKLILSTCILTAIAGHQAYAQNIHTQNQAYYNQNTPQYVNTKQASNTQKYVLNKQQDNFTNSDYFQSPKYGFKPYIGADLNDTKIKFNKINLDDTATKDLYYSFSLITGARFSKHFGAELFYQQSEEHKSSANLDSDYTINYGTKFHAYGLDIIAYLPFNKTLELLVSGGIGEYNFDLSINSPGQKKVTHIRSTGGRVGTGLQYNLNEHLALRLMARYVWLNEQFAMKNMIEASVGLRCSF